MADGAVASINFTIPEDAEDGQVYNVTISSVTSFSTATDGDVAVDSLSLSNGTITVEIPEETTEAPTEEATTEAPTAAPTEEATTAAATTAANQATKTGDVAPVALMVVLFAAVATVAVVAKKKEA